MAIEQMNIIFGLLGVVFILYLLAIMPRMVNRPDHKPFLKVYYAHRGLHDNEGDAPENSLKAFQKAVEAGYGIELDVQLSKDKIPVVFHDFTLGRVCGREGKVCEFTYQELSSFCLFKTDEKIPTLQEVLSVVDGKVPLIVELKIEWTDAALCPEADRLLSSYGGVYCIESFNPLGLLWYRKNRRNVMRGQLSDAFLLQEGMKGLLYFALEHLFLNFLTKPDFIAYNHKYHYNLSRVLCHRFYRAISVGWTFKNQRELETGRKRFELFIFDSFEPNHETGKI